MDDRIKLDRTDNPVGTKMLAEFTNASSGHPVVLELRGDFWGGSGDIAWDGRPVAQITRDLMNAREIFTNNQTVCLASALFPTASRSGQMSGVDNMRRVDGSMLIS